MNKIYVLLINLFCLPIYTMQSPLNPIWIKTKDKKIINVTYEEACQSFYISECNRLLHKTSSKKCPIKYDEIYYHTECFRFLSKIISAEYPFNPIKRKRINITNKEILFFKKITHQPALYNEMTPKKYIKALNIAEQLKAPLLYAGLLQAKLPHQALILIIEKYKTLSNISDNLDNIMLQNLYFLWQERKYSDTQRIKHGAEALSLIETLSVDITLPQVVLLDIICNKQLSRDCLIRIIPHMPGFNELEIWQKDDEHSILHNLHVNMVMVPTKKKERAIDSFTFRV